jgi:hypothetical protein
MMDYKCKYSNMQGTTMTINIHGIQVNGYAKIPSFKHHEQERLSSQKVVRKIIKMTSNRLGHQSLDLHANIPWIDQNQRL